VVRQAVRQTYTYYYPDGSVKIVEDAPLAGRGKAWVLGAYNPPVYPSPLNVRVGDAGIKVWMVINWLRLCDEDVDTLLKHYGQVLQREDVEAAKWYYQQDRETIDRRLREEAEGV
jgi:uncharacterized protein (DUF433 family)